MTESAASAPLLSIERLYASPSLNGPTPKGVKFSPDGQRVTFLKAREEDSSRYDLWQFDVATGEQSLLVDSKILEPEEVELSEEEKALRERKRIAGQKGIVSYDWGTADTILVPIGGDLHLITLTEDGPQARQLTQTDAFEYDARVSPLGNYVSFVRDGAVYAIALSTGEETRLTPEADPENAISYGVAEFVAQEEMSRYTGYWWSPDETYIAYTRVDESTVDIIPRFDIRAEDVAVIEQRYPRAGRPNAIVDLFVRDMETGEAAEVNWRRDDWGPATDQYLARVNWYVEDMRFEEQDGEIIQDARNVIVVQRVNRDQTRIELYNTSLESGSELTSSESWPARDDLFSHEKQTKWVNLSNDLTQIDWQLFWTSEQSGFRHIVNFSGENGNETITSGDWAVAAIEGVGVETNTIFFTGWKDTPLEKHLYAVPVEGGEPTRITEAGKSWSITMSPDGKSFVGTSSSPTQPPQTGLYRVPQNYTDEEVEALGAERLPDTDCIDLTPNSAMVKIECPQTELIAWIEENKLDESHPYFPYLENHTVPDYGTLTAEDGQALYYSVQKPPNFDPAKKYPVIVEVYGGPHVQTVTRNWERLSDVFYTHQGYIVFRLDNRGSYNRGKKFEDVIYRQTGKPEVADQLVGVNWLKAQPFVDADRVAIQGWSYGGYMTLMTSLQAPEGTFAAAVSGAPVTDWTLYDTFYTERYMDTPEDNPDGYEASSVFPYVDNLTFPLLLIHGMADDNVTFDNSTRLMAEIQQKGLPFELMTYPGQRHGIRGEELQIHLMKTRMNFLNRHLRD